jgi:D-amino-acid dehydrogenase
MRSVDVLVLGAGITGISAALHLQGRGWSVLVVDGQGPGEVSSRGNTGVLERTGFLPLDVPSGAGEVLASLLGRGPSMRIDARTLPALRNFLRHARQHMASPAVGRLARALAPLQAAATGEHLAIARAASAFRFFRRTGWLKIHRSDRGHASCDLERHFARIVGVPYEDCGSRDISRLEPDLMARGATGVFWPDSQSVSSPGGVTKAYARFFRERGGEIASGDTASLEPAWTGWQIRTSRGIVAANQVVLALGADTPALLARFGHALPLAELCNRHLHFRAVSGVSLSRPVSDLDGGYMLTPMERGVRLVADRKLVPTGRAGEEEAGSAGFSRAVKQARQLMPLGSSVEDVPVVGRRVLTPDGLPAVGPVPGAAGLWLQLGSGTAGFALAPAMGRMLAELMSGDPVFVDPVPFAPARFLVG